MEKLKIRETVLVEGKYDKIKLESVLSAHILTASGFSIFHQKEKLALLRRIALSDGLIVLTDSDPAGFFLRAKLKGLLPKEGRVYHLYTPSLEGKEKRKRKPSKAGILGVEGTDPAILRDLFAKFAVANDAPDAPAPLTKAALYELGLSGRPGSTEKREQAARRLALPKDMTPNAFLEALNLLKITREELERSIEE